MNINNISVIALGGLVAIAFFALLVYWLTKKKSKILFSSLSAGIIVWLLYSVWNQYENKNQARSSVVSLPNGYGTLLNNDFIIKHGENIIDLKQNSDTTKNLNISLFFVFKDSPDFKMYLKNKYVLKLTSGEEVIFNSIRFSKNELFVSFLLKEEISLNDIKSIFIQNEGPDFFVKSLTTIILM